MSSFDDFTLLKPVLEAMPPETVSQPNMPVRVLCQEAETLYRWAKHDQAKLAGAGLPSTTIEGLQPAIGAARYAEGLWYRTRFTHDETRRQWDEKSAEAYALFDSLVHAFLYAFRNRHDLLGRVRGINEGAGSADRIQGLVNLSLIGRENRAELEKINFDLSQLDAAESFADTIADLLGETSAESGLENDMRDMRDRAYTLLRNIVNDIRECGKYVFYRDERRYRGYTSGYHRVSGRSPAVEEPAEPPPASPVLPTQSA